MATTSLLGSARGWVPETKAAWMELLGCRFVSLGAVLTSKWMRQRPSKSDIARWENMTARRENSCLAGFLKKFLEVKKKKTNQQNKHILLMIHPGFFWKSGPCRRCGAPEGLGAATPVPI